MSVPMANCKEKKDRYIYQSLHPVDALTCTYNICCINSQAYYFYSDLVVLLDDHILKNK